MKKRASFRLSIIMIVFALLISFTIATIDYFELKNQNIKSNEFHLDRIEEMIKDSIQNVEKAYLLFGEDLTIEMKSASQYISDLYKTNPNLDQWDFQQLKDRLSFDIYMIDEQNTITHSSLESDIGLDFSKCCQKLVPTLNERRTAGGFFADVLDIEQHSGQIKKYSYMATTDKKYLIQLGFSLEDDPIFKQFNFLQTLTDLIEKYPSVNEINVLNIGGYSLGEPINEENKLSSARRKAFEHTLTTTETTETEEDWRDEIATYRYVHYVSKLDTGATKNKVLEIVYNDKELRSILSENKKTFIIRLTIVLIITALLSFIISSRVTRLISLAFHDHLTGLKNKAAFEKSLEAILKGRDEITALLIIDLDNFKRVNDRLGHKKGDELLIGVAERIQSVATNKELIFRWGGDEFVMIMPSTTKQEVEHTAESLISVIPSYCLKNGYSLEGQEVTVSIGISFAPRDGTKSDELYKKADMALYQAKEKGKNQYQFYS